MSAPVQHSQPDIVTEIVDFLNATYDAIGDLETDKNGNVRWAALVNIQREIGQKACDYAAPRALPKETPPRPGVAGRDYEHGYADGVEWATVQDQGREADGKRRQQAEMMLARSSTGTEGAGK